MLVLRATTRLWRRLRARLLSRAAQVGGLAARRLVIAVVALGWLATVILVASALRASSSLVLGLVVAGLGSLGWLQVHRHHRLIMHQLRSNQIGQATQVRHPARANPSASAATDASTEVADRLRLTALTLGRLSEEVARVSDEFHETLDRESKLLEARLDAVASLQSMLPPGSYVPPAHTWGVSPLFVARIVDLIVARRYTLIVTCSGGPATLWCALAIKWLQMEARIVALEHDERSAGEVRERLAAHGVAKLAEVRYAPVEAIAGTSEPVRWYASAAWADLRQIGLVALNGPPHDLGSVLSKALGAIAGRIGGQGAVLIADSVWDADSSAAARLLSDRGLSSTPITRPGGRLFVRPAAPRQRHGSHSVSPNDSDENQLTSRPKADRVTRQRA